MSKILEHIVVVDGCWIWQGYFDKDGYGLVWHNRKQWRAHRLSFQIYNGPLTHENVLHTCDTPACCNPKHLFLGSQVVNLQDASAKGRLRTGIEHHACKLTDQAVAEIKVSSLTVTELAVKHGVSKGHISNLKKGKKRN